MTGYMGHPAPHILFGTFPPHLITQPQAHESAPSNSLRKPTVLVVDDEGLIADSIAEILNQNGYDARPTYGGRSAITLAEKLRPDLLLTDVLMPRINGIETAIQISKMCEKTRIVLFSGQAGAADLLNMASASGLSFELLPKPIHPQQLLRALASMLRH